jgi:polysaccharide pyruvyl transferase WcaK-like protein
VLDAADVGRGRPITYNAVGGLGLGDLPNSILEDVRRRLGGAAFISVRDPESRALLESWDLPIDVLLSPDSAVLAPRAFPISELLPASARKTREAVSLLGSEFLTFQVGRYPAWGAVPVLAEEIRKIHRQTGLGVLLLPLGQAAGHEDLLALRGIADLLPDLPVELLDCPDVVDVLACIANSRLFVGSSLHGNLMVRKLDLMFRTWDPSRPDGVTAPTGIAELATRALVDNRQDLEAASASLADKAMAAFEQQSRLIT